MAKKTKNEAGKLRSFYRVETMGLDGKTIGGYVSAMMYLFTQILGVRPEEITEELLNSSQCKNEDFDEILITMGELCDIPQPQEYVVNKKNYCLYQKDTFLGDEIYELRILDEILQNLTDYRYSLVVKEFKLRDDEIIYEDPYQVVASEAVYKKHNKNKKCDELAMMMGLDEEELEDEDDYWGEFFNDTAIENDLDMEIDYRKPLYEKPKKVSKKSKGGKEKMTYEKIVEKVKKALSKVDASGVKGHLSVQVDVYGEGEGAFYIEVKDGKVDVQPYEYFDHDLRIRCTGEEIIAIAEGKKKVVEEVVAENVEALRKGYIIVRHCYNDVT